MSIQYELPSAKVSRYDPTSSFADAFDHFNANLFECGLPEPVIVMGISNPRAGAAHASQVWRRMVADEVALIDEIAINPVRFALGGMGAKHALADLVHKMVHNWQAHYGTPSGGGWHNAEWSKKMFDLGLCPTIAGEPIKDGPPPTGLNIGAGLILPEGRFERAADALMAAGWGVEYTREGCYGAVYVCPECGAGVEGATGLKLQCGNHDGPVPMPPRKHHTWDEAVSGKP